MGTFSCNNSIYRISKCNCSSSSPSSSLQPSLKTALPVHSPDQLNWSSTSPNTTTRVPEPVLSSKPQKQNKLKSNLPKPNSTICWPNAKTTSQSTSHNSELTAPQSPFPPKPQPSSQKLSNQKFTSFHTQSSNANCDVTIV